MPLNTRNLCIEIYILHATTMADAIAAIGSLHKGDMLKPHEHSGKHKR
jgi:hypothetical protein